jgi:type VI secretion system secreted protein VgrG
MADLTQENRPIRVDTILEEDKLLLESFTGREAISTPYAYDLDMLSVDPAVDGKKLLRSPLHVTVQLPEGERVFHGCVRRFSVTGQRGELTEYSLEMVPWFWFLSLSKESRIYQNKSVLEIVEQVFKDQGYSDFEVECVGSYQPREYCVQYNETHLDFVSRLLEEEGIFYFFRHTKDKHVLVLGDNNSSFKACDGQSAVRMVPQGGRFQEDDVVTAVEQQHAVHAGTVTLRDFDYLKPTADLEASVSGDEKEEVYEYPGGYIERSEGDRYAGLRLEQHEVLGVTVQGDSNCRSLESGHRFELKKHPAKPMNREYILVSVEHAGHAGDFTADASPFHYSNNFLAIPSDVKFRPALKTPRPLVMGSQTAVVVGKSGEEIWVDKHGRVKVQFHWDREGKRDENSSCWVRVSSAWAGKGWGFIQIPRVGQEVIVDFLEGDPHQPIITGRVWNGDNAPPYDLPANQTQSGVKSRSSAKGGTDNFNEIRFEDKKDSEEILIHAEKDLLTEVENDETRTVGNDRTTTIENNETKTVKSGDESITLEQGSQTLEIKMGDQTIELGQGSQTLTIKMGDQTTTLNMGNITTTAKLGNVETKANVGKVATEALQGIEFTCGPSSIKIDPSGVTIKGIMVTVEGTATAEVKGPLTQVNGTGMLKMQGGLTMIN